MFIRRVTKYDKKTKQPYHSFKLVENYRTDRGPRQRILLYLGNALDIPQNDWKKLANRIEEICYGTERLLPCSNDMEQTAQRFARLLIKKQSLEVVLDDESEKLPKVTFEGVLVDLKTSRTSNSRSIGTEHILYETFKSLNLHKILKDLGFNKAQISYAAAAIISRAVFPSSERRTHFFLQKRSAMDELMGVDFSNLPLRKLYQISDLLLENKQEIEGHLEKQEKAIFKYDETIILYDITNTYFEGSAKANPKAKYGHSKEKRRDCPLVSAGIVLNKQGFIKRSEFLPGNVVETKAFADAVRKLHSDSPLFRPIVVIDGGMASQENINWLKQNGYRYVTIFRRKRKEIPLDGFWTEVKVDKANQVSAYVVDCPLSKERHLYCHSTARARREAGMKTKIQTSFEKELDYLNEGLCKPRRIKKYKVVLEKIGKLKEKYKRIARYYTVDVEQNENGNVDKIVYKYEKDKLEIDFSGSYCLRTDITDMSTKELWDIYMMLSHAEEAFRDMKAHLGLRPVYHSKEDRVDGHMWITILAYHLVHAIIYQLREKNLNLSWQSIRDRLASQQRVTSSVSGEKGTIYHVRTTTEPEEFVKEIYRGAGVVHLPIGRTIAKM